MLAILTTHPVQYQVPIWQALAKDGRVPFEVWYLTDFGTRPSLDREFAKTFSWDIDTLSGYPHRFVRTSEGASPVTVWKCRLRERLRDRLRRSGAKVLWIQGWQVVAYWQAAREARAAGVELWLRAESNDLAPPAPSWKRQMKQLALGRLLSRVDRFLCIGVANKRLYRRYGVPESRFYLAPYAVDNERFARQALALRPQKMELRRQWRIGDDAFCVLFCGKFIKKKRPLDLVEAARSLISDRRLRNIHLLFVGSGELEGELKQACHVAYDAEATAAQVSAVPISAASWAARPPASFAGFLNQTEISRAYVAADCLVLPSDHRETWGLVVNEALASDLPCLVSDACGCAEDLAGDEFSFPVGNLKVLADNLIRLHSTPPSGSTQALPSIADSVSAIASAYFDLLKANQRCKSIMSGRVFGRTRWL
jgi:glycosyltransferase involved in cell wall biosynthesis